MTAKPVGKVAIQIPPEDLIDVPGGAALIWVKQKTVWNWLAAKKLTRYKAGRRTLVRKSEILAMVREA